jgi:hypothetical protein
VAGGLLSFRLSTASGCDSHLACAETPTATFSPGAIRVNIGRPKGVAIVLILPLIAALSAACFYAAFTDPDRDVNWVGVGFGSAFALLLLAMVIRLPRVLKPHGLVFDVPGLHYWHGTTWGFLPWTQVAAVGVGYSEPPKVGSSMRDAAVGRASDGIMKASRMDTKRRSAVEIFPAHPQLLELHPALASYRRDEAPPAAGLAPTRWRITLPLTIGAERAIVQGMTRFAPQRWLGVFCRPWTPLPR